MPCTMHQLAAEDHQDTSTNQKWDVNRVGLVDYYINAVMGFAFVIKSLAFGISAMSACAWMSVCPCMHTFQFMHTMTCVCTNTYTHSLSLETITCKHTHLHAHTHTCSGLPILVLIAPAVCSNHCYAKVSRHIALILTSRAVFTK